MSPISASEVNKIITDDDTAQLLVQKADSFGKELKELFLSTSQIRSLFGEVRQIQGEWTVARQKTSQDFSSPERHKVLRRLILLKPKMHYRARRERGQAVRALVDVLDPALDAVINAPEDKRDIYFDRFVDFFEAILAYHRSHGGN